MAVRLGTTTGDGGNDGGNNDDGNADDGGEDDGNTDDGNEDEGNSDDDSTDEPVTCDDIAVNSSVNPFEGKNLYVNPTYQTNLDSSIATATGVAKTNLQLMRDTASAYWIDVKAKL